MQDAPHCSSSPSPPLFLMNSFSGKREAFVPQNPSRITMYVCGPTVYNHAHIGNARPAVVFDLLFRLLRHLYGDENVLYARNITDIDDKMIAAAEKEGVTVTQIAATYKAAYQADMSALYVGAPDLEPHATHHIEQMITLTTRLLRRGHAYIAEGHVLFDVTSYPAYGRLSKITEDSMIAGARVEVAPYKKSPADFVLWKPGKPGEPVWELPAAWAAQFGPTPASRPGWHLECSAMIEKSLLGTGETSIDIHGGGLDLRFPHHENEIAQSCCAGIDLNINEPHTPLARYWLHNGFVQMGDDKMSKSLGNIVTPHDLLKSWDGEVLRLALLSAQYRQPLDWNDTLLEQSKRQLDRFYRILLDTNHIDAAPCAPPADFINALKDDLNTPEAFAVLHRLREAVVKTTGQDKSRAKGALLSAGKLMGLFNHSAAAYFKAIPPLSAETNDLTAPAEYLSASQIDSLLEERQAARIAKNFTRADEIRDHLAGQNIVIEDSKDGARWRRR